MSDDAGPNLLILLEQAAKRMEVTMLVELRAAGFDDLRPAHSQVFGAIAPEGTRVGEMAATAGITQQSMSELVDSLEGLGYLERRPDPHDRRARIVAFTARGWEAVRAAVAAVDAMEQRWAGGLGRERASTLRAILERIVAGPEP